jgi:transcriptional regulator with XRE-family HTH domain
MLVYYVFTYIGFIKIEKRNSMNITQETIKENKQKILDLETLYKLTGTTHIYKELASIFGVSSRSILYYESKGQLKDKLELLFDCAKNHKGNEIQFNELQQLIEQSNKRMKRGKGATPLLENDIREAQSKSLSAHDAARKLGISYNTYKKYAKSYGIFENLKNPFGIGIIKNSVTKISKKPKKLSDEQWAIRKRIKDLKKRHLDKFHTKTGEVRYGCALYFITIPKGTARQEYISKWGTLPIKIGISKDVINRYKNLVLTKDYIYSKESKWVEWNESAEIVNMIPFYTWEECIKVESIIHKYIRDIRIEGIKSKGGSEATELFEADFGKINEAIETYVTGWRTIKWNLDEMNNDYGTCYTYPFSIVRYNRIDETEFGSKGNFF